MENNNINAAHEAVITDFDFKMIAEFFSALPQQGPGSDAMTLRAMKYLSSIPRDARIADLGCGTGRQTALLAKSFPEAEILAEDLLPEALEGLKSRMIVNHINNVYPVECSMDALPWEKESLDVIWAEGSIYNIGFERGLGYWHDFLKPSGILALTDCCYLLDERPDDDGWLERNFVDITFVADKVAIMEHKGYKLLGSFSLPSSCWTEDYYKPMLPAMARFLSDNPGNPTAEFFVARLHEEMDHYKRFGAYYGYVFFIARKV
ncbi:MAG: class I SAM-dependent methyltransferase [Bacteroidales bacterium]|nr:class I SAM-dependent methyltransferase [Bacteroidales bacterium]